MTIRMYILSVAIVGLLGTGSVNAEEINLLIRVKNFHSECIKFLSGSVPNMDKLMADGYKRSTFPFQKQIRYKSKNWGTVNHISAGQSTSRQEKTCYFYVENVMPSSGIAAVVFVKKEMKRLGYVRTPNPNKSRYRPDFIYKKGAQLLDFRTSLLKIKGVREARISLSIRRR